MAPVNETHTKEDAILPMTNEYMQQIVSGKKTYEFRRYRIAHSVQRIWFYINAPLSSIMYICEIDPGRTRKAGDDPLPEDGLGNREYNTRHKDWERYDYAYRLRSVRALREPITLDNMKEVYGMKGAPRSLVYLPSALSKAVAWEQQSVVWSLGGKETASSEAKTLKRGAETQQQLSQDRSKRKREDAQARASSQ